MSRMPDVTLESFPHRLSAEGDRALWTAVETFAGGLGAGAPQTIGAASGTSEGPVQVGIRVVAAKQIERGGQPATRLDLSVAVFSPSGTPTQWTSDLDPSKRGKPMGVVFVVPGTNDYWVEADRARLAQLKDAPATGSATKARPKAPVGPQPSTPFLQHEGDVRSVAYARDVIASTGNDDELRMLDRGTGAIVSLAVGDRGFAVAGDPEGAMVAVAASQILFVDGRTGAKRARAKADGQNDVLAMAFVGDRLIACSIRVVFVVDVGSGERTASWKSQREITGLALAPTRDRAAVRHKDGITILSLPELRVLETHALKGDPAEALAWCPRGLLVGGVSGVELLEPTGTRQLSVGDTYYPSILMEPSNDSFLLLDAERLCRVPLSGGEPKLLAKLENVVAWSLSPDGTRVALAIEDRVHELDAATGAWLHPR